MALSKFITTKRLIVFALACETLSATYMLNFPSLISLATILYALAGITIAITFLLLPEFQTISFHPQYINHTRPLYWYKKAIIVVLGIVAIRFSVQWMEDAPMDYHDADMLPIMKIMCQRFLAGKGSHVYDIIPEIWHGIQPVYFPAMWMPYCIAVFHNFDLRWITVTAIFSSVILFFALLRPMKHQILTLIASLFMFITLWWILSSEASGIIPYTEEGIIIFYYSLLALALFTDSFIFLGVAISLCVLSRYALAGWLPAMLVYWIWTKQYKGLLKIVITGLSLLVLLMLLPFGIGVFQRLFFLPGEYIDFARRVWNDSPHLFNITLGFAKFFGKEGILLQHKLLLISALGLPTIFMTIGLYYHKTNKNITLKHLPIAILKIGLVIFYCMIDVPYLYLFYTSLFFSFIVVVMSLRIENQAVGERK